MNEIGYFRCSCPTGYRLDDTFSTCVGTLCLIQENSFNRITLLVLCLCHVTDVDECEEGISGCTQECTNSDGSFVCSCNVGYLLESNGKTCTGIR